MEIIVFDLTRRIMKTLTAFSGPGLPMNGISLSIPVPMSMERCCFVGELSVSGKVVIFFFSIRCWSLNIPMWRYFLSQWFCNLKSFQRYEVRKKNHTWSEIEEDISSSQRYTKLGGNRDIIRDCGLGGRISSTGSTADVENMAPSSGGFTSRKIRIV